MAQLIVFECPVCRAVHYKNSACRKGCITALWRRVYEDFMPEMWVIYEHPSDYPDHFVARRFIGEQPTSDIYVHDSLWELRGFLRRMGLVSLQRDQSDDPVIVESWV